MSRYDDLWSVYYISVENMVGQLPWRFVNEKNEVAKMKEGIDLLRQRFGKVNSVFKFHIQFAKLRSCYRGASSSLYFFCFFYFTLLKIFIFKFFEIKKNFF